MTITTTIVVVFDGLMMLKLMGMRVMWRECICRNGDRIGISIWQKCIAVTI